MTRTSRRAVRLIAAAALVVPALLGSVASSGATPRENLAAGQSKLHDLQHQLEVLSEQVNTAQAKLDEVNSRLADARATKDAAELEASKTRALLSQRAVAAYVGAGSQLEGLLGAQDFNDFSDRLQYAGALAQNDADLAAKADAAGERAQWAAEQFASVAAEQRKAIDNLHAQQDKFQAQFQTQQAKVADLQKAYRQWQAAQAAARRQAAADAAAAEQLATSPTGGTSGGGGGGGWAPPPNSSGAQVAIAAAKSEIGTPYVFGTASPGVSFDCSGLTSWAWGQAGVYLPHSSTMQAAMTPDVSYSELQPGDLVFFYSPISHVGLYIGGGQMVDASHSGPGGEVDIRTVYTSSFTVGGRVT
jgi:cell wall-associated NlpC family hydrolase